MMLMHIITDLGGDDDTEVLTDESTEVTLLCRHLFTDAIVGFVDTLELRVDTTIYLGCAIGILYESVDCVTQRCETMLKCRYISADVIIWISTVQWNWQ